MRIEPSLVLRRMVVARGSSIAYDESFHNGVNVIRGENSSGKSTVLNFVHYALGGDVSEWSETALLCDRVVVEVSFNGSVATLSRLVVSKEQQPMEIFFGSYVDSLSTQRSEWQRFPYRRLQERESFSQVIFRLLNIPEAANEDSGNITIHQIMRLLYADQLSPVDQIFPLGAWDNERIREAVGKILCGAFDEELYSNDLSIRDFEKQHDRLQGELQSLFRALGDTGHDLTPTWLVEQRARNEDERLQVGEEIRREQLESDSRAPSSPTLAAQELAYENLIERQKAIGEKRVERDMLEVAIVDSALFIRSLEEKLIALKDAALISSELGSPQFSSCPACYAEIGQAFEGACALCKEPIDAEIASERIGGLINDTALQLKQSRLLQEYRSARLADAEAALEVAGAEWRAASRRYAEVQSRITNEQEVRIGDLYKRLGYLERQDEDLSEKAKTIELISSISRQKAEINNRLNELKERNDQIRFLQRKRLDSAYLAISDKVRGLLAADLDRQDTFDDPQRVDFSFADNKISVDGHKYFSASSRAILKSAFFLGFHAAALENEYFRHPRFLMLDTIEDKGMEAVRSQNFQRLILDVSNNSLVSNQVIFATAMIAPELDHPEYVVGRFYTRQSPSLLIG